MDWTNTTITLDDLINTQRNETWAFYSEVYCQQSSDIIQITFQIIIIINY